MFKRFCDWITCAEMAERISQAGLPLYPSLSQCEDYCDDNHGRRRLADHSLYAKTLVEVWVESETT